MRKQNIVLTIWLALPITIVSLMMVWIFVSLDKSRLMAGSPPIGAGAGDTGNANALGQWLAGRDADEVSDALDARREGRAIDPRDRPGGIELLVSITDIGKVQSDWYLKLENSSETEFVLVPAGPSNDVLISVVLSHEQVKGKTFWLDEGAVHAGQRRYILPQIPDPNLQVSDPMVVELRMDSVYEDSP